MAADHPLIRRLCDTTARTVYYPVRHHSPAAAKLLRQLIGELKPAAVLIEGPFDYNPQIHEMYLGHALPIAIYSYVRLKEDQRCGAYYPFCEYSPEWQALMAGKSVNASVEFIDLPWADLAGREKVANRYADVNLRRSAYVKRLCAEMGVDDFDALWDELFEIEPLSVAQYMERCHLYCLHSRDFDGENVEESNLRRETFMAAQIRRKLSEVSGQILVVTGGYHSSALLALEGQELVVNPQEPDDDDGGVLEHGIALTPYSYERLDSLKGYESGMPGPGFYHCVWRDRNKGMSFDHDAILATVVRSLRKRGQTVSSADLIGVETTAQALATLRSHADVWRRDLIDGLKSAVLKDEVALGCSHPLLSAILDVFRGNERGRLAKGTSLPPLVEDFKSQLDSYELAPEQVSRDLTLDWDNPIDAAKARILHRARLLNIAGFTRTGGTDLHAREDLAKIWESWRIAWSPEFDSSTIEAARYGASLSDAAAAVLIERGKAIEHGSGAAAELLLDAAQAGLAVQAVELYARVEELLHADGQFFSVVAATRHLLYLYKYDRVLNTYGLPKIGALIHACWTRALGLFESLGQIGGKDAQVLKAVSVLVETFEVCSLVADAEHSYSKEEFVEILGRVASDSKQAPAIRGAATGALWVLGCADPDRVVKEMKLFADPSLLGDYLTGVFCLAREPAQRHPEMVQAIDELIMSYDDEQYLVAIPSLRLAFTYFTPREKHHLALNLLSRFNIKEEESIATGHIDAGDAAKAIAFEAKLYAGLAKYGLRGAIKP